MDSKKELEVFLGEKFSLQSSDTLPDTDSLYFKEMQKRLAVRIEFYINFKMEELLQILYKIDIPQSQTDKAFQLGDIKEISLKISELIISRQLKKIEYSRNFTGDF